MKHQWVIKKKSTKPNETSMNNHWKSMKINEKSMKIQWNNILHINERNGELLKNLWKPNGKQLNNQWILKEKTKKNQWKLNEASMANQSKINEKSIKINAQSMKNQRWRGRKAETWRRRRTGAASENLTPIPLWGGGEDQEPTAAPHRCRSIWTLIR